MIDSLNLSDGEFSRYLASLEHKRRAPSYTEAFVYAGQWVADCVYPSCANCEPLEWNQYKVLCRECHYIADVRWPVGAARIAAVLDMRPVPTTRNWAPAGHRQAIACGFPEGQSVDELIAENEENL